MAVALPNLLSDGMEGYLIRVPRRAWGVASDGSTMATSIKRHRNSGRPQAKLLYYILGEGYLQGFASPDDLEPVESFQLTSFNVSVEPIFSMLMFKVTTSAKRPVGPRPIAHVEEESSGDDDEDEEDHSDDEHDADHGDAAAKKDPLVMDNILLFTGDRPLVGKWCQKIHNWNRYVFAGGGAFDSDDLPVLAQAKRDLVAAFADKVTRGLFTTPCELVDCTRTASSETAVESTAPLPPSLASGSGILVPPPTPPIDKPGDPTKTSANEIKPLWMLLTRGPSRRISAVPYPK